MVRACLNTGSHYLDITGEIGVFEAIMSQTEAARSAGVSLIPGMGFDVAPTDCLAAQLAAALPDATDLQMAFYTQGGGLSGGTAKTGIEHAARGNMVRRAGKLVAEPLGKTMREVPFSPGPRMTISIPWGDVSTAWYTTGIPNIRVYTRASQSNVVIQLYLRRFSALLSRRPLKRLAQWIIGHTMSGPSLATRENARVYLWGQVRNAAGDSVSATFDTPEGYSLTVTAALAAVERVLSGEIPPGSWTPARAFGADFGQQLAGVTALDIQRSAR